VKYWKTLFKGGNMSKVNELIEKLGHLELDQVPSVLVLQASDLISCHHPQVNPSQHVWIQSINSGDLGKLKILLSRIYPGKTEIVIVEEDSKINKTSIEMLEDFKTAQRTLRILIPPISEETSFEGFEELVAHLRAPNGCPWDREQTHASLRTHLLEETYEALDALDKNNMDDLKEELGDLLLQIVLHAEIATESDEFLMGDILQGIHQKIVRRHPHVFGDAKINEVDGVLRNWERLKETERDDANGKGKKGILDGVPLGLPSLTQAQEYQDRAARVGFDWKEIDPVLAKVHEELAEVKEAKTEKEKAEELGDLLFAVVNLVRWYKVDAESALRNTNRKFATRFRQIETEAKKNHRKLADMTLEEMDVIWEQTKKTEKQDL
jgi:tetrapyrrole methylase family protein/MazG family protein